MAGSRLDVSVCRGEGAGSTVRGIVVSRKTCALPSIRTGSNVHSMENSWVSLTFWACMTNGEKLHGYAPGLGTFLSHFARHCVAANSSDAVQRLHCNRLSMCISAVLTGIASSILTAECAEVIKCEQTVEGRLLSKNANFGCEAGAHESILRGDG